MKIGDKVKVIYKNEYFKGLPTKREGSITVITKHFLVIQFEKYKESFKKTDILAKGWVDMELKQGREWINVDKEVMK